MIQKIKAAITGVSGFLPEDVLDNAALEKIVDTNDEWIRSRTGILQRRILRDPGKGTSDLGAGAVKLLLEKTGNKPSDIKIIPVCCIRFRDFL